MTEDGGLLGLANGIEKSLAAFGHVTLSYDDWKDVVSSLRLAASLPDGSGQRKSADGGQCNEQSAQGLSRALLALERARPYVCPSHPGDVQADADLRAIDDALALAARS